MRLSRCRTIVVIAILLFDKVEESAATEPIISYLECKGSTSYYRNGVFSEFYSGVQEYYRIGLRSSDAVVESRTDNRNYNAANRYDMKVFDTSYELAGWWNNPKYSENIKIDRLNGNFTVINISNETNYYIEIRTFGTCYKIGNTPKF